MNYKDGTKIIYGERSLCTHLVRTYHEACHEEDAPRLAALCSRFGITEYVAPPQPEPTPHIPQEISRAKGLVICKQYGILETVKAVVAAKDAEDGISQIKFDNAGTFRRDDPLLAYVAGVVGLTDTQLDQMFIDGEALWE